MALASVGVGDVHHPRKPAYLDSLQRRRSSHSPPPPPPPQRPPSPLPGDLTPPCMPRDRFSNPRAVDQAARLLLRVSSPASARLSAYAVRVYDPLAFATREADQLAAILARAERAERAFALLRRSRSSVCE